MFRKCIMRLGVMGLTSSTLLILPKLWDRPAGATSVKSFMVVLASVSGGVSG